tara:strand:- start:18695 stop:19441 length:747 start_codon:yes stop_codon:yes gene_type:complete
MAGHSKWANIKHRKAAQDAKRGKVFNKLIRELTVAAKLGGPEPADNPRLRAAVDKSLTANMTRDTIDRAIARGVGSTDADTVEELTYEGYGPGGVAVLVEVMTDNRNRTVSEVRHAFNKCGGNLGTDGSVAYLFARRGQISYGPGTDENALIEEALEAGAEDIIANSDGSVDVFTAFEDFGVVRDHLDGSGFTREAADISMIPVTIVSLDLGGAESVIRLVDMLEDLDDVQNVYSNADIPDDVMEQLG